MIDSDPPIFRAVKSIPQANIRYETTKQTMTNDVYFIKLIDHPNVLKGHEFYEEKGSFYFVHEYF